MELESNNREPSAYAAGSGAPRGEGDQKAHETVLHFDPIGESSTDDHDASEEVRPLMGESHVKKAGVKPPSKNPSGSYSKIRNWLLDWKKLWKGKVKTATLTILLVLSAVAFAREKEVSEVEELFATPALIRMDSSYEVLRLEIRIYSPVEAQTLNLVLLDVETGNPVENSEWSVSIDPSEATEKIFKKLITLDKSYPKSNFEVTSTSVQPIAFGFRHQGVSTFVKYEVIFAGLILGFVYFLIVFELIHRTLAALLGSFLALAALSALNQRPSLEVVIGWIDYETVMLLFGMMIIVGILSDTGVFEFAAVKAYKFSNGHNWRLITLLCLFSAVVSAFLDNVTTILLLTPVTIRMCNVIGLDARPVLLAEVIFSNVGGTATAVGDPPNVIIVSSKWDEVPGQSDINFTEFTLHLFLAIVLVMPFAYLAIRILFRNVDLSNPDPPEVAEIKREILIWQKAAGRLTSSNHEEEVVRVHLIQKIRDLEGVADDKRRSSHETWSASVARMEQENQIKDPELLVHCSIVLFAVIMMFFVHSIPEVHLDLGWIAILGAICLMLVSDIEDLESLLEKIEWGTLMFFASLFVLMEALAELGLINWIGDNTASAIKSVDKGARLEVAILLVLWVSALASSFIDNIPFTTAMIPVIKSIASDPEVGLPLRPLVWALALGACLGGNGTLIGASANVVCAGLAEQEGITISFNYFFKTGFPVMLITVFVASIYLLICHSAIGWQV